MTEFPVTRATLLFAVQTPENREAREEFVVIYRPVIYRMARRRGMQDADAQDVTQNVLISVSEAIKHYDQQPGTRFRHWLKRVAKIGRRTRDSDWSVLAICCHLKWVAGVGLSLRRKPRGSLMPRSNPGHPLALRNFLQRHPQIEARPLTIPSSQCPSVIRGGCNSVRFTRQAQIMAMTPSCLAAIHIQPLTAS